MKTCPLPHLPCSPSRLSLPCKYFHVQIQLLSFNPTILKENSLHHQPPSPPSPTLTSSPSSIRLPRTSIHLRSLIHDLLLTTQAFLFFIFFKGQGLLLMNNNLFYLSSAGMKNIKTVLSGGMPEALGELTERKSASVSKQ